MSSAARFTTEEINKAAEAMVSHHRWIIQQQVDFYRNQRSLTPCELDDLHIHERTLSFQMRDFGI